MSKRYIIMESSKSAHCCFEATVMDSTKPEMIHGKHYEGVEGKHYETICECFNIKEAQLVCDALNLKEKTNDRR